MSRKDDLLKVDHDKLADRVVELEEQMGRFHALTFSMRGEILRMLAKEPLEAQRVKLNEIADAAQAELERILTVTWTVPADCPPGTIVSIGRMVLSS